MSDLRDWDTPFGPSEVICKENAKSFTSLEEAARLYAIPHYMKDIDVNHIEEYPYDSGLEAAFKAGAKWMSTKMMKEAVEVAVEGYIGGDGVYVFVDLPTRIKVDEGDVVKVIIVKDE